MMATIKVTVAPGSRVAVGDEVLARAKTVDAKPVGKKLAAFAKAHAGYLAAERAVRAAEARLHAAQAEVGEADAVQDQAVVLLAAKLIGDGAPKGNPFKPFGLDPPSALTQLAVEKEVQATAKLAKAAAGWKPASAQARAQAAKLKAAVAGVKAALARVLPLERAQAQAIAERNGRGVPWARAFAQLKRACRVAEDDGASGLYAALFAAPAAARPKPKPPAPEPAPPPPNGTPPASPTGGSTG